MLFRPSPSALVARLHLSLAANGSSYLRCRRNLARQCRALSSLSKDKGTCPWVGLGGFAKSGNTLKTWRELRNADEDVEAVINRYHPRGIPVDKKVQPDIDWDYWKKTIKHPGLVECLQASYENHVAFIDQALKALDKSKKDTRPHGDDVVRNSIESKIRHLHQRTVEQCEAAVTESEELIADGARAVWLSNRNPPAWKIAADEWLDSDAYWQAYVERHHHFDSSKDIESYRSDTFEDEGERQRRDKDWMRRVNLFHDRSDTPTLYSYMDQLHSSDYYDLYRRVFLEHMLYFLIRTGHDYHFFPEIPPASWIVDIERMRYLYVSRAHQRRLAVQQQTLNREEPLDLCPRDSELEHAEDHFLNLLSRERSVWESTVGRWMMDFMFLCHPAIPIQSQHMLRTALAIDRGKGTIYTLGDDVTALFYVPYGQLQPFSVKKQQQQRLPRPSVSYRRWVDHLMGTGQSINQGYLDLLELHAHLVDKRGEIWFAAPGESVAEAFLRRFLPEDPQRSVYADYVSELQTRWASAKMLTFEDTLEQLPELERRACESNKIFEIARCILFPDLTESQKLLQDLRNSHSSATLDKSLAELQMGYIALEDDRGCRSVSKDELQKFLDSYEIERDNIAQALANVKYPGSGSHRNA